MTSESFTYQKNISIICGMIDGGLHISSSKTFSKMRFLLFFHLFYGLQGCNWSATRALHCVSKSRYEFSNKSRSLGNICGRFGPVLYLELTGALQIISKFFYLLNYMSVPWCIYFSKNSLCLIFIIEVVLLKILQKSMCTKILWLFMVTVHDKKRAIFGNRHLINDYYFYMEDNVLEQEQDWECASCWSCLCAFSLKEKIIWSYIWCMHPFCWLLNYLFLQSKLEILINSEIHAALENTIYWSNSSRDYWMCIYPFFNLGLSWLMLFGPFNATWFLSMVTWRL